MSEKAKASEVKASVFRAIECGYTTEEASLVARTLPAWKARLVAAMAIKWLSSPWSDKDRDLYRGLVDHMGFSPPEEDA